jgi:hypothetical protein
MDLRRQLLHEVRGLPVTMLDATQDADALRAAVESVLANEEVLSP